MIRIELDAAGVTAALTRLAQKGAKPEPLLKEIGEDLLDSTLKRFETGTGPDGQPWKPNAIVRRGKSARPAGAKRPLIETGQLSRSIRYQIEGGDTLAIGTNWRAGQIRGGAAIHQLGGQAGRGHKVTIPARPFLGISAQDEAAISKAVISYLGESLK